MSIIYDREATKKRRLELDQYLSTSVLGTDFVCADHLRCRSSHTGAFYEGQLHHVGRFYDLIFDNMPLRVVVVGQEYGHGPSLVDSPSRHAMIMRSALGGYSARNPHMRGTTNVLRLLFGIPLGTDLDSEFITIEGKRIHIFDAFALVNYLLCTATEGVGTMRGIATPTMKKNCKVHFSKAIRILDPSIVIVQGKTFWPHVRQAFDSVTNLIEHVYRARLGSTETLVAVFAHPSARYPHNWGVNDHTPYLLGTVVPTIATIRQILQGDFRFAINKPPKARSLAAPGEYRKGTSAQWGLDAIRAAGSISKEELKALARVACKAGEFKCTVDPGQRIIHMTRDYIVRGFVKKEGDVYKPM